MRGRRTGRTPRPGPRPRPTGSARRRDAGRQRVRGVDQRATSADDSTSGGHDHAGDDQQDLERQRRGGEPPANAADAVLHHPPAGQDGDLSPVRIVLPRTRDLYSALPTAYESRIRMPQTKIAGHPCAARPPAALRAGSLPVARIALAGVASGVTGPAPMRILAEGADGADHCGAAHPGQRASRSATAWSCSTALRSATPGPAAGAPDTPGARRDRAAAVMPGLWDCHGHFMGSALVDLTRLPQEPVALRGRASARGTCAQRARRRRRRRCARSAGSASTWPGRSPRGSSTGRRSTRPARS